MKYIFKILGYNKIKALAKTPTLSAEMCVHIREPFTGIYGIFITIVVGYKNKHRLVISPLGGIKLSNGIK